MISELSNRLVSYWLSIKVIHKEHFRAYAHGCELIISDMISNLILFIIAVLLEKVVEMFIFLVVFSFIRMVCGGYHASSYRNCILLFTFTTIVVIIFTVWCTDKGLYAILVLMSVIADACLFILAPVDNPNKPLSKNETIKYRKKTRKRLVFINMIILFTYLCFPVLADEIAYALTAISCTAVYFGVGLAKKTFAVYG